MLREMTRVRRLFVVPVLAVALAVAAGSWLLRPQDGREAQASEVDPLEPDVPEPAQPEALAGLPAPPAPARVALEEEDAGPSVAGRVADDLDVPLTTFDVRVKGPGTEIERTFSGPAGRYRLEGLEPGSWEIAFAAPGHEPARKYVTVRADQDVDVRLRRMARVSGVVLSAHGEPCAEAEVFVRSSSEPPLGTSHSVERNGSFDVEVPPGGIVLNVRAPEALSPGSIAMQAAPGEWIRGLELVLETGAELVLDIEPLDGIGGNRTVLVGSGKEVTTGAANPVHVRGLDGGSTLVVVEPTPDEVRPWLARLGDSASALLTRVATVELVEGRTTFLRVEAFPVEPVEVTFHVLVDGRAPAEASLVASPVGLAPEGVGAVQQGTDVDRSGHGRIVLLPGPWHVDLYFLDTDTELEWVEDVPPGSSHAVELLLRTGEIVGTAQSDRGEALTDLSVVAEGVAGGRRVVRPTFTDEQGEYVLEGLPAGTFVLRFGARERGFRWPPPHLTFVSRSGVVLSPGGSERVDVELAPGGSLRVFAGSEPLESLRVTARGPAGELVLAPEDGRFFSIYGIPAGSYDVEVVEDSTGRRAHGTAEVRVGEVTEVGVSPDRGRGGS